MLSLPHFLTISLVSRAPKTEQAGVKGGAGGKPEVREGPAPVVPVGGEPLVGAGVGGGDVGGLPLVELSHCKPTG